MVKFNKFKKNRRMKKIKQKFNKCIINNHFKLLKKAKKSLLIRRQAHNLRKKKLMKLQWKIIVKNNKNSFINHLKLCQVTNNNKMKKKISMMMVGRGKMIKLKLVKLLNHLYNNNNNKFSNNKIKFSNSNKSMDLKHFKISVTLKLKDKIKK